MKLSDRKPTLIVLDIGNTWTKIGLYNNRNLFKLKSVATSHLSEITTEVETLLSEREIPVVIASVVPLVSEKLQELMKEKGISDFFFIRSDSNLPIKIEYETPTTLGVDRICNVVAVMNRELPCAVIDIGSMVTIDVLTEDRTFIGGVIMPGPKMLKKAIHQHTAQLPEIELQFPMKYIGYSTLTCLQSGVMYGLLEMIDGMITRVNKEIGVDLREVIATGGYAEEFAPRSRFINTVVRYLTLEGARSIYEFNS